jgi:hypothetical protein
MRHQGARLLPPGVGEGGLVPGAAAPPRDLRGASASRGGRRPSRAGAPRALRVSRLWHPGPGRGPGRLPEVSGVDPGRVLVPRKRLLPIVRRPPDERHRGSPGGPGPPRGCDSPVGAVVAAPLAIPVRAGRTAAQGRAANLPAGDLEALAATGASRRGAGRPERRRNCRAAVLERPGPQRSPARARARRCLRVRGGERGPGLP